VEPELTPALTPEQVRELYAADHIEALRRWKRSVPRRPHHCRVGTSYYPEADRSVPYIRLRGGWLAQAGFVAGDQVRVEFLRDALVLSRIPPPPPPPEMPKRRSRKPSWRD